MPAEKVQEEIDRVVGQKRQPTMADRSNMPFTDAVIHEIQRMGNIVPLNGLRMAARDTTLGGYFIPKVHPIFPQNTPAECSLPLLNAGSRLSLRVFRGRL